ncbi:sensor histidine kinase [Pedobacter nototheniae]|uniref:sensor histidine kinase n=1 Tax=Pedobacter nototheniae TaxID=2488994 RepID=UPI00292E790B|nr:ATP-binding protein [Pedobacter nototheniae]
MQISSKEIIFLISIITIIFLTIPLFLIAYIRLYNRRKRKHSEEKELLKKVYENELLKSQMEVQEQTLKTVAYDLHDNIGQLLGLTIVTLSSIDLENVAKAAEKIAAAEELTKRSVKAIRALSRLLHGEELLSRGLTGAIAFELDWVEKSGIFKITYVNNAQELQSQPDKETIIFRLFQEILNNILKHAKATEISINLDFSNNNLTLAMQDNGIGFKIDETSKQNKGMGLHNIQKRAEMIGGNATFYSEPGSGTKITITTPY